MAPPLTLIVTTSPCRGGSDVHRALLRTLFASFGLLPELTGARVIVVCDGYKLAKPGGKLKLKGGIVSPSIAEGYAATLSWLRAELQRGAAWLSAQRVELLELPEWRGWSSAVEHALRLVETPHVMVIQDDRCFTKRFRQLRSKQRDLPGAGLAAAGARL